MISIAGLVMVLAQATDQPSKPDVTSTAVSDAFYTWGMCAKAKGLKWASQRDAALDLATVAVSSCTEEASASRRANEVYLSSRHAAMMVDKVNADTFDRLRQIVAAAILDARAKASSRPSK